MPKRFVIHEHHARRLHWDLRLEIDGVLRSWAVPKGPSLNPADKRLAVAVPDHSVSYIDYEGRISDGSYGAGEVRIWDDGTFETSGDPVKQLKNGKLVFTIFGLKLRGEFALIDVQGQSNNWLLIKGKDDFADPKWELEPILVPRKQKPVNNIRQTNRPETGEIACRVLSFAYCSPERG
jgi:bifunctional non-homologous end joining protein LigD